MGIKKYIISATLSLVLFVGLAHAAFAAQLEFDPATVSTSANQQFKVKVIVDTVDKKILAVDAKITYNSTLLEVIDIADGDPENADTTKRAAILPVGKKEYTVPGQVYIAGIVNQVGDNATGRGTLATITFKAKQNGTTTLAYTCTPGDTANDSNIAADEAVVTDIIDCSLNKTAAITIGDGQGPTDIPTTTVTTTVAPTRSYEPTPSELPRTGFLDEMVKFTVPGVLLVVVGVVAKLLLL